MQNSTRSFDGWNRDFLSVENFFRGEIPPLRFKQVGLDPELLTQSKIRGNDRRESSRSYQAVATLNPEVAYSIECCAATVKNSFTGRLIQPCSRAISAIT